MCIFNATHGFAPPNAHLGCDLLLCLELLVNLVGPHHVHGAGDVGDRPALPHLSPVQCATPQTGYGQCAQCTNLGFLTVHDPLTGFFNSARSTEWPFNSA